MEYIILASSPGIATQGLLDLFNSPGSETVFVAFAALRDAESVIEATQISATRIVFHGEYNAELVKRIHTTHPTTKNILVFDTAEAALLQEFARNEAQVSLDTCISHWADSISQLTLLAEQNTNCSALVDYTSLTNATAQILALLNTRLGLQLTNCTVTATSYSSIAQLIAAAALIDRDEAMVFYDDAKTLALTSQYTTSYADATSLVAKQHPAALNEFQALLKYLQSDNAINNIAAAAEQQQSELDIAHITNNQLHEEMAAIQSHIKLLQNDTIALANARQTLVAKDEELTIARMTINQLREEIEAKQTNIGNLQQELTALTNTNSQLHEEMAAIQSHIKLLQNDTTALAGAHQTLIAKDEELTIAHMTINQLREEITTMEFKISNAQQEQLDTLASTSQQLSNKESELAIGLLQIQQLQEELGITQLTTTQLREEVEATQTNIGNLQQELTALTNTRQQLNNKQSELEIALLQLNQLQEELEDTLEKYSIFERPLTGSALIQKVLSELPLLGLLRNQTSTSAQAN